MPEPEEYRLTTSVSPAGSGSISPSSRDYEDGTFVKINTAPNNGYRFSNWSGGSCSGSDINSCEVFMTRDHSVTANYVINPVKHRLSVSKTGTGTGTITSSPAGISCGTSCSSTSAEYNNGTSVTLTATAGGANTFGGWGGACAGRSTNTTCSVSMTEARSVTARFDGANVTCALSVSPASGKVGDSFTFTARRTGGTATGTISYSNHSCSGLFGIGGGTIGGISGNTFRCTYSQPSGGTFNQNVGQIRINQGGVSGLCSLPVTVTGTTPTPTGFYIDLVPNPGEGPEGTTFTFTATPRNIPTNAFGQQYSVSYPSRSCGGVTPSGTGNRFTCTYPTAGMKTATINATATPPGGGIIFDSPQYATGTASVLVEAEEEIPVEPPPPPPPARPTATLTGASPIVRGSSSTLRWSSRNATSCTGTQFSTGGATSGTRSVSPGGTTTYSLTCSGPGGISDRSSFTVQVTEPAIARVNVRVASGSPAWVSKGGDTRIEWTIVPENAGDTASCTVLGVPGGGPFEYTSRRTFDVRSVQEATEYTVRCTNDAPSSGEGDTTVYVLPSFGEF